MLRFLESINLNDQIHLEFYDFLLFTFPNCEFNIQCNYIPDQNYWEELKRFHQLKINIKDNSKDEEKNKSKYYSYSSYTSSQITQMNKCLSLIKNLHDLYICYDKKRINLTDKYVTDYSITKPEKITFENFGYEYRKRYFGVYTLYYKYLR